MNIEFNKLCEKCWPACENSVMNRDCRVSYCLQIINNVYSVKDRMQLESQTIFATEITSY